MGATKLKPEDDVVEEAVDERLEEEDVEADTDDVGDDDDEDEEVRCKRSVTNKFWLGLDHMQSEMSLD